MKKKNICETFIDLYAAMPYHAGKWRMANKLSGYKKTEKETVRRSGVNICLEMKDVIQRNIFFNTYEINEIKIFESIISPTDQVFDVGANIGFFSLVAANRVGKEGRVFSFEPARRTFERLQANLELNDFNNIKAFQVALSDQPGTGKISEVREDNSGWTHLSSKNEEAGESVPVMTLDLFVERENICNINLIKVDIEGYEAKFLKGAENCIKKFRPRIIMEINQKALSRNGHSGEELIKRIKGLGYKLYVISKSLEPLGAEGFYSNENFNILAEPKEQI